MAKISVSIPDELKEQLDTYAEETGFKRSEAVAHILTAYFQGEVSSPTPIDPAQLADIKAGLQSVQNYLDNLHSLNPDQFPRSPWNQEPRTVRSFIGRE
ncbi:MAG: ribbon-helix-helix domain-containing protein [Vulcanimicrobiota bacterium]